MTSAAHRAELGYESSTWESDIDTTILDPRYLSHLTAFWRRQYACLALSKPAAKEAYLARLEQAKSAVPAVAEDAEDPPLGQPEYITVAQLEQHQLIGAAMLRRMYLLGNDAVIADGPALGIAATVLTYMQVRHALTRCAF